MSTKKVGPEVDESAEALNEVRLTGRISGDPEAKELPSGDTIVTFRVVVRRPAPSSTVTAGRNVPRHDTLDCVVWRGRVKRSASGWRDGDVVEIGGALRRRFYRAGGTGAQSRVDVEVDAGRVIRRAAT